MGLSVLTPRRARVSHLCSDGRCCLPLLGRRVPTSQSKATTAESGSRPGHGHGHRRYRGAWPQALGMGDGATVAPATGTTVAGTYEGSIWAAAPGGGGEAAHGPVGSELHSTRIRR